jgi:hypothetical protein
MNGVYKRQYDVESFTNPRQQPYKISERHDGRWECSCPAWKFHTPRADCKHIRKVQGALRIMPSSPVFGDLAQAMPARAGRAVGDIPQVAFDGYAIRRRPLDDMETWEAMVPERTGRRSL